MDDLKDIEMELALQVKKICERHDIKYFIDYGTFLGAVRHQGYIPWDDDFDFGMLRNDYERFISFAKQELPENMFLQTYETDLNYGLPFAKIRMNNTIFLESTCRKCDAHSGVYVDIFPYDNFDTKDRNSKLISFNLFLYSTLLKLKCKIRPWYYRKFNLLTYLKFMPFVFVAVFFKKETLIRLYEKNIKYYNNVNCEEIICSIANMKSIPIYKKANYKILQQYNFENTKFSGPKAFDEVLTSYYGDYMKIPDLAEQKSTHDIIMLELNNHLH